MGEAVPKLQMRTARTMSEMARGRNQGAEIEPGKLARLEKLEEWQREYGLKMYYDPTEDQTLFMIGDTVVCRVSHWTLWPSDEAIANIALAVMAGVKDEKRDGQGI